MLDLLDEACVRGREVREREREREREGELLGDGLGSNQRLVVAERNK